MRSMKVIILLLFCYACLSTDNGRVQFVSRNFNNILQWDPVKPAFPGEKVLYTVWYWSDASDFGASYRVKEQCQNITTLSCNLTTETPSRFDVHYLAKVTYNNGRPVGSTFRFRPSSDTILGAPNLSIHTTVSSLHVKVIDLPLGPKGDSIADIFARSKKGPHKTETVYTLKITHPEWAAQTNRTTTGQFVINLKNNQTEYCGYVVYKPSSGWNRPDSERAFFCVTLPDDPLKLLPWLLVSTALLTAIIIMSIVCMWNYAKGGKGKSMPDILVTTFRTPTRVLQYPDRNCIISKPEIYVQTDQTVYATIQMKPNMPPVGPGGYSPQDIPWQDSTGSSVSTGACSPTPNPENTSAQSSEIYSVVAVHVPAEQDEDFQQATNENSETSNLPLAPSGESWDNSGMSPKLTSHGVPPLPDQDPCESNPARPLLLHTGRDPNGRLTLPSFAFQLQSSTDATASPLNSERKPLLSDLIDSNKEGPSLASMQSFDGSEWSDSGCDDSFVHTPTQPYCNSHYSPSQTFSPYLQQECQNTPCSDAIFESGYKQNWMTANILGTGSKDSFEYRTNHPLIWTAPEKEEKDEDGRGEEKPRQILLGSWGLQIQE